MNDSTPSTMVMMENDSSLLPDDSFRQESVMSSLSNVSDMENNEHQQDEQRSDFENGAATRKEYALLKAAYKRIQKGKHPSELVLISGLSGTGKSKLAESIREPVTLKRGGFFVRGKFDSQRNEPFSALVEAFTDLCDLISQDKKTCLKLSKALAGDISVLSKVIPNLSRVVATRMMSSASDHHLEASVQRGSYHHAETSFTQLKLACRKFLATIANKEHPVVLLIDDVQWADKESLDIVQSIVTDTSSMYLLVMCTYRSNNVDSVQVLLDTSNSRSSLQCTSIHLDNFDSDQVASLIAKCTHTKSRKTRELASLVVKRTNGNPFFVIRFLEMLEENNLLTISAEDGKWAWSMEQIQEATIACDNVVEIVKARIQSLNHVVQSVLRLAAMLGFTFDRRVIEAATWKRTSASSVNAARQHVSAQVKEALMLAEAQGLIESNTDGSFRFCHDTISDCLYSMTPRGIKLASAHLLLDHVMQDADNEQYVFAIADQLNRAKILIDTNADRLDCAQCNLRAAEQALGQSAFDLASEYAQHGLDIVDDSTKWDPGSYYATVLDLHCVAAEALYCCGNLDESNEHLQQVFQHAESLADVTRARVIHVNALGAHARLEEAIDVAFCGARELGVKLPRRPSMRHAIWQLIKTKAMMRGKSDDQLMTPPTVEYEGMTDVAFFLRHAAHFASVSLNVPYLILSVTTLTQLWLKGKCPVPTFCLYGILEVAMGNIPEAVRMANVTLKMHEIQDDNYSDIAGDVCVMHSFLTHWKAPLSDSLDPLQNAYVMSMESAQVNLAFLAVSTWIQVAACSGYPLDELERYTREYCCQMQEFKHKSHLYHSLPYWQFCLNMQGRNDEPVVLTGEAMDERTYSEEAANEEILLAPQTLNIVRIMLACQFESSHIILRDLVAEYDSFKKPPPGHFLKFYVLFYVSLAHIKLYRVSAKRSDKRKASKVASELRKWSLDGCPNTKPLWALINAELAALVPSRGVERVRTLFLDAIKEAAALQNSLLEAMARERLAQYYYHTSNEELARPNMERAIQLYEKYGAFAKIESLERKSMELSKGKPKSVPEMVSKECPL